ncbi:unnamed protein product [Allacma fusca]|uniref:Uncharacterized protein n=1 Tax=Allacma fusca TaxID=39272 RepID=A0A8J2PGR3_9HEXA|nr:unnamed protein product [Allacma fusca]
MTFKGLMALLAVGIVLSVSMVDSFPKRKHKSFYDVARSLCKIYGEKCERDEDCCNETCRRLIGIRRCDIVDFDNAEPHLHPGQPNV